MTAIALTLAISSGVGAQVKVPIPLKKTVIVGTQSGALTFGNTSGTATFAVTTTGIDNNQPGSVSWYSDAAGTTLIQGTVYSTLGLRAEVSAGAAKRTLKVTTNAGNNGMFAMITPAGTYYFRVTIDDVKSNVGELLVKKPLKEFDYNKTPVLIDTSKLQLIPRVTINPIKIPPIQFGEITIPGYETMSSSLVGGGSNSEFKVTTRIIGVNEAGEVLWFSDEAGTIAKNPPSDLESDVSKGNAIRTVTFTHTGNRYFPDSGNHYFRVKVGNVTSHNVGCLWIFGVPR